MINFTPNITDEKIEAVKQEMNKEGKRVVSIVRNINKMTDPADDGLRMPLPLASMKIKKPKKKKKWSLKVRCKSDVFLVYLIYVIILIWANEWK